MTGRGGKRKKRASHDDLPVVEPTVPTITLVADEMLDEDAVAIATERGARVLYINAVMPGAEDDEVAAFANIHSAIVATLNLNHFKRLISRQSEDNRMRNRSAGLLGFSCKPERVNERLRATWDFVVAEWTLAQTRADKRVIVEIGDVFAKTFR